MAIVVKTIGGRRYFYEQKSVRVGRKVKSIMRYIGPADTPTFSPLGKIFGNANDGHVLSEEEMIWRKWITKTQAQIDEEMKLEKEQADALKIIGMKDGHAFLNHSLSPSPSSAAPSSPTPSDLPSETSASPTSEPSSSPSEPPSESPTTSEGT